MYASVRVEEMALVPWSDDQKRAFVKSQFDAQSSHYRNTYPNGNFLLIKSDDEPVGRVYHCELEDEHRIIDITVAPEFRGRGIGTKIIKDIIEGTGKPVRIYLEMNNRSVGLFQRLGFGMIRDEGFYRLWSRSAIAAEATT
jgi:ribosomal protein S18 acetylase RimI-like enzyme